MPRKPKKQPAQTEPTKSYDEFVDDSDVIDDEVLTVDDALEISDDKSRDWRDVEKYKEERALKRLVDDDFDLDDL
ncbi:hypothetical protein E4T66_04855 [Sinimarinibacterium sp. CAU 1509]|uniref:hypothetical protein n=1 Tax=Sinimarinibacterium sp. CAU 1509 TaxID=2562283 RepID=UPI0010AC04D8|nr:hypothetical protein [Sinimarinibacterium sp. CAU 1509]TJY63044.1 hypothetical protein E4T66_04855 [Sinimarinibacterium sp. CAU 1509]